MGENWTFNEAIQYYMSNPLKDYDYNTYVDKHKVKDFVKDVICVANEYAYFTTPKEVDDYDYESLPSYFIIKGTHGWNWNIIVRDNFNKGESISRMKKWLSMGFNIELEKQYAQLTPGVLIEEYLGDINDYKFYVFNGSVELIQVDVDRFGSHKQNFYDTQWNIIPVKRHVDSDFTVLGNKPDNLGELIRVIRKLSEKIYNPPFVRIDIYNIKGKLYFGEYTFTPSCGWGKFFPKEYEIKYGKLISKINH